MLAVVVVLSGGEVFGWLEQELELSVGLMSVIAESSMDVVIRRSEKELGVWGTVVL